jgi:hypothetical protein
MELGLRGLLTLAASSKQLSRTCLAAACDAAVDLLAQSTAAIAAADGRATRLARQHMQAAKWLLRAAPAAVKSASVAAPLVRIANVPPGWALQLVAAGVRISYAQLLAAADSMVQGVEVWMKAQQQLGVQTDTPMAAVALCCDECAGGRVSNSMASVTAPS